MSRKYLVQIADRDTQPPGEGLWTEADFMCAIEVCTPAGQQVRHLRQPGESLADLEARANPTGTWHARPMPIVHEGTAP